MHSRPSGRLFVAPKGAFSFGGWHGRSRRFEFHPKNAGGGSTHPRVISREEFLGELNHDISDYIFDKVRLPHGETERQKKQRLKEQREYLEERSRLKAQKNAKYDRLVESGEIRPPTKIEQLMSVAHGHPDLQSVQAARRLLKKRGYDWKTGNKL